ncbi:MAG: flagellar export protein FliJ [Desulfarculales bacterium]|jgi:flagellar FliJ protein|nr:flagellar export protein FliJ [Desulfarculales bacterium]
MAFKFRLQSVLNHRLHLEDKAKAELGLCLQAQKQCEERVIWLREEMLRIRRNMTAQEQAGMDASSFILNNEYVTLLRLQALREEARLPLLIAQSNQARSALVEAMQNRKALDLLMERDKKEYEKALAAMERNLLDEVAVGAYARGKIS